MHRWLSNHRMDGMAVPRPDTYGWRSTAIIGRSPHRFGASSGKNPFAQRYMVDDACTRSVYHRMIQGSRMIGMMRGANTMFGYTRGRDRLSMVACESFQRSRSFSLLAMMQPPKLARTRRPPTLWLGSSLQRPPRPRTQPLLPSPNAPYKVLHVILQIDRTTRLLPYQRLMDRTPSTNAFEPNQNPNPQP